MDKELLLLRKLYRNPESTQRNMAKATGISLGCVNALIKDFVKKDIIKVKKVEKRTTLYSLTSVGINQKSQLTYKYIEEACEFLRELSISMDKLIKKLANGTNMLVLFGRKDALYELIVERLDKNKIEYKYYNNLDDIIMLSSMHDILVVVWEPENINTIKNIECSYVNLLGEI